jgi:hypothetical protein
VVGVTEMVSDVRDPLPWNGGFSILQLIWNMARGFAQNFEKPLKRRFEWTVGLNVIECFMLQQKFNLLDGIYHIIESVP